ncbi:MAG: ABC transporter permease [Fulvivirga sp.]|uniref:ABC transporter permease n=1 Tax=Fulvivirga sp. TaxID=1931237 RepID=UPI0032EBBBC0
MVKNYLKVALRSILKKRVFSLINILGLSIGAASFLLIIKYVDFENSYDNFHSKPESLYRVQLNQYLNNELMISSAENYPGVGPAMVNDIPEVKSYARLYNMGYKNNIVITYEDAPGQPVKFKHRKFLYADSAFLPMFGYEMAKGDASSALTKPNTAVLSEKYAKMYFGDEEPIGKMIRLNDDDYNDELCEVTGVFKDLPANTHLKFDVLFSYKTLYTRGDWAPGRYNESWRRKDMYTYVRLDEGAEPKVVESKLNDLLSKYSPDLSERNRSDEFYLQPIESIHLTSSLAEEPEANGDAGNVQSMMIIAIFIILIAWVNYVNLSTARALERANEVGVRKAMGAFKKQLMYQFLMESAIINLLAVVLSILLIILCLPMFNRITGLSLLIVDFFNPIILISVTGLWLVGTILSGLYPSFVLSSFKPVSVLKGKMKSSKSGIFLRKGLVVFQFIASVGLIAGTLIIQNQLDYMMNQDIGLNVDQVLVVERPGVVPIRDEYTSSIDVFRNEIAQNENIKALTASVTIPGKKREFKVGVKPYGSGDDAEVVLRFNSMDYSFIDVFEMKLLAGRAFSEDFINDSDTSVILTKKSSELLGFKKPEDAIGATVSIPNFRWNPIVVGVVNDYNQESLQEAQDPTIFYCTMYGGEYYSMKVNTTNLASTIEHVEKSYTKAFPGNPFSYFFLDDYFNRQYENEQQFGELFSAFSILAILVGSLGLFGLAAYTAQQRTKEVSIRKVLGSSNPQIFVLLSKGFMGLIGISILIAVPLTYYFMDLWLNSFAYKQPISFSVFIYAGVLVLGAALITISFQTVKAMNVNPVNALRHE